MVNTVFQNKFPLGNLILLLATNIVSCFSELIDSHHSLKKKKIPNTHVCSHNFSSVLSNKNGILPKIKEERWERICISALPRDHCHTYLCSKIALCVFHIQL